MYKLLLCWRYLRTRYLALACIISVMLGVATLIVVNSVMSGFSTKLKDRLHGFLSDVVVEAKSTEGMPSANQWIAKVQSDPFLAQKIAALAPTLETFALLQFDVNGEPFTKYVRVVGVDAKARAKLGGFAENLTRQKDSPNPSFDLTPDAKHRLEVLQRPRLQLRDPPLEFGDKPPPAPPPDIEVESTGIILGHAIAHYRRRDAHADEAEKDICVVPPGTPVTLYMVSGMAGGGQPRPVPATFVVTDYFKSEMSDYDSSYVFVPLDELQNLRTMQNKATSIEIKLHNYDDAKAVTERLKTLFPEDFFLVSTWEQKQGALLSAIDIEKGILNVLLFLIICVAGFGILAIFAMIVVEKTRDIGILKALGASNGGVMKIFLGYGLLLGVVGAGFGTAVGLLITSNINGIEKKLTKWTGHEIFDRSVYYFNEIPIDIQMMSVLLVNVGAVCIAVFFSVLPALRAAMLHPVRALRYE